MKMMINRREVEFKAGATVLEVAKANGIDIPNLCYLETAQEPYAGCRLCLVEVEGQPKPVTSCTLKAQEGMSVRTHTEKILRHRRNIVEMILANHPNDCLYCGKGGHCQLQKIAGELGLREQKFFGEKRKLPPDLSSPSIVREPDKCVLCGRCVTVCQSIQKVGILEITKRGFASRVSTGFYGGLGVSPCISCGQCIKVCPTGALTETAHLPRVIAALGDSNLKTVFQIAPSIPVAIGNELMNHKSCEEMLGKITGALYTAGAAAVFDTTFAADLTVMEESAELLKRIMEGTAPLPMFTSCSPGWIRYVENYYPNVIPHLSTCKSPQQMAGAIIKRVYAEQAGLKPEQIFSVSVMPCTAKKMEAEEFGDIDAVLTTREFIELFKYLGIDLEYALPVNPMTNPMSESSGAGRIFGASGGVMEATVRTVVFLLSGENPREPVFPTLRGEEGIREASFNLAGREIRCCIVNGIGNAKEILDQVSRGQSPYHFIEVMTCPGGCVEGGGQPVEKPVTSKYSRRLYQHDKNNILRFAHENEQVKQLYREVFGNPLSKRSHEMLHRTYRARNYQG
jgi:iron-only hydrogenase group A